DGPTSRARRRASLRRSPTLNAWPACQGVPFFLHEAARHRSGAPVRSAGLVAIARRDAIEDGTPRRASSVPGVRRACDGASGIRERARRPVGPFRGGGLDTRGARLRLSPSTQRGGAPWARRNAPTTPRPFERTSKRRRGFPSETHVKR